MGAKHTTREEWLHAAVKALEPTLKHAAGMTMPKVVRLSCGWPTKPGKGAGWCFESRAAADKATHIFVIPTIDSPPTVLAILLHEMIHAADDCKSAHGGAFAKAHKAVGFTGKPTASTPSPDLEATLHEVARALGPYPHKALMPSTKEAKQSTRMLKVECNEAAGGCGMIVRTTRKWLEASGLPSCGCGAGLMRSADLDAEEELDEEGEGE